MAIEWQVGSGVGYATWYDALIALLALGNLANDYDLIQIRDVTEINSISGVGSIQANGHTVRFYQETPLKYKTYLSRNGLISNGALYIVNWSASPGHYRVNGIDIERTDSNGGTLFRPPQPYDTANSSAIISDIKINGNNGLCNGMTFGNRCGTKTGTYTYVHDIKIWDCQRNGIGIDGAVGDTPPRTAAPAEILENITIYNCAQLPGFSNLSSAGIDATFPYKKWLLNNVVCAHTLIGAGNRDFYDISIATGFFDYYNCACTDAASLDGIISRDPVQNIVPADEFISLDDTSPDFLKLPVGSKYGNFSAVPNSGSAPLKVKFAPNVVFDESPSRLGKAGIEPSAIDGTEDIEGLDRPGADGHYSIGCHEMQYQCTDVEV